MGFDFGSVISEVDLDVTDDGLALRGRALSEPWGRDAVWVVHTKKNDRELAQIVVRQYPDPVDGA